MKITQMNGNSKNGQKGSRLSVRNAKGELIDQFIVPSINAKGYCKKHPNGVYGRRLAKAIAEAQG